MKLTDYTDPDATVRRPALPRKQFKLHMVVTSDAEDMTRSDEAIMQATWVMPVATPRWNRQLTALIGALIIVAGIVLVATNISIMGALLASAAFLSVLCATIAKHHAKRTRRRFIDPALETTQTLQAIGKQANAFPMLQADTAAYLQSVKVFSERRQP